MSLLVQNELEGLNLRKHCWIEIMKDYDLSNLCYLDKENVVVVYFGYEYG